MAVEIVVISGARQGVHVGIERNDFRVGATPDCDVFFDPQTDPGIKDRAAAFRLQDDGWYVRRTGGGTIFVNHQLVQGAVRLRSGDIVRMSDRGPDLSFTIVKQLSAEALKPGTPPPAAPAEFDTASGLTAVVEPLPMALPMNAAAPMAAAFPPAPFAAAAPIPAAAAAAPEPFIARPAASGPLAEPARAGSIPPAVWLVAGVALGLAVVVTLALVMMAWMFNSFKPGQQVAQGGPPPAVAPATPEPPKMPPPAPDVPAAKPEGKQPPAADVAATPKTPEPAKADAAPPADTLKEGVFLLEVELPLEGGTAVWPLATCCAIREDTLITSAAVAIDVLRFRQDKFKVFAVQPERDLRVEVKEARLHAAYVKLIADHAQRRFFNLALLTVEPRVAKTFPLSQPDDLVKLDEGFRLSCVAYSYPQVKKLTRHDHITAEVYPAEIFLVKSLQPHGGLGPRSLDVTSALPPHSLGSPLLDPQGKLVAVYTETPGAEEAQAVPNLQFATVVNPQWIAAWLTDHDDKQWIVPQIASAPAKTEPAKTAPAPATPPP